MRSTRFLTALLAFAVCLGTADFAFADSNHGRGRDRDNRNDRHNERDYRSNNGHGYGHSVRKAAPQRVVYIYPRDRIIVRDYMSVHARPVLYRAEPSWRIGRSLPRYVHYQRIPPRLLNRLQPVPVGYEYVQVDNDILLITQATRLVIDAITRL